MMPNSVVSIPPCSTAGSYRIRNRQQQRKFRDSCVHCAKSKVKCDKEKPTCGRCARRHLACEYKLSCRTGRTSRTADRPPSSSTIKGISIPSSALLPVEDSTSTASSTTPSPTTPDSLWQTSRLPSNSTNLVSSFETECSSLQAPNLWRSVSQPKFSKDGESLQSTISSFTDGNNLWGPTIVDLEPHASTIESLAYPTPPRGVKSPDPSFISPSDRRSCAKRVWEVFEDAFSGSATGCRPSAWPEEPNVSQTTQSVVSRNKQLIGVITAVLDCPCVKDDCILAFISLTVLKLADWYIDAAQQHAISFRNSVDWYSYNPLHEARSIESLFDGQVWVPAPEDHWLCGYHRDQEAARLMMSELYRIKELVDALSLRMEVFQPKPPYVPNINFLRNSPAGPLDGPLPDAADPIQPSGIPSSPLLETLKYRLHVTSTKAVGILLQV